METNIGRIWLALLVLALAVVVFSLGDSLKPIGTKEGEAPFLTALTQLGNPLHRCPLCRTLARSSHQGMATGREISS